MRYVCLYALTITLTAVLPAAAQRSADTAELTCEGCTSYNGLVVDVQDSQRNSIDSVPVERDGNIPIRSIREGMYFVTVRTPGGHVIAKETLNISRNTGRAVIRVPERAEPERPGSGTVSVKRLQHKVPKAAKKEYQLSVKAYKKKDLNTSIEHLKKAIEIDPEYMEAQNDLGTRYIDLNDPKTALIYFRRALELEPTAGPVQVNVAISLMALKQFAECEQAARRAVELDTGDMKARLVLGLALYSQQKYTPEAADQLRRVQDLFPRARLALAVVQASMGDVTTAKSTLTQFMANGLKPNASRRRRCWRVSANSSYSPERK